MNKFSAGVLFGLVALFLATSSWGLQPRLVLEKSVYDFGSIFQGTEVEHVFRVKNEGSAPLTIRKIKTSCGCTVAEKTFKKLAPGEVGEIRVLFDSTGKRGEVRKRIFLYSNDPENPDSRLLLVGQIKEFIEFTPRQLRLQAQKTDGPARYKISLVNKSDRVIGLEKVICSSDSLDPSLSKNEILPGETVILDLSTVPGKSVPKTMRVEVFTDQENMPKLVIPVRGVANRISDSEKN